MTSYRLKVVQGRDLVNANKNAVAHPHYHVFVDSIHKFTVSGCLISSPARAPIWLDSQVDVTVGPQTVVRIECWDWRTFDRGDFIGEAYLPAKLFLDVTNDKLIEHSVPLQFTPVTYGASNGVQPASSVGSLNGSANGAVTTGSVRLVLAQSQFCEKLQLHQQLQESAVRIPPNPTEYVSKLYSDLASGANFHQKHNLLKELKIVSRDLNTRVVISQRRDLLDLLMHLLDRPTLHLAEETQRVIMTLVRRDDNSTDPTFDSALALLRRFVVEKGQRFFTQELGMAPIDTRYIRVVEIIRCCAQTESLREDLYSSRVVQLILEGLARCDAKLMNVLSNTIDLFCSTESIKGLIFRDLLIALKKWVRTVGIEVAEKELFIEEIDNPEEFFENLTETHSEAQEEPSEAPWMRDRKRMQSKIVLSKNSQRYTQMPVNVLESFANAANALSEDEKKRTREMEEDATRDDAMKNYIHRSTYNRPEDRTQGSQQGQQGQGLGQGFGDEMSPPKDSLPERRNFQISNQEGNRDSQSGALSPRTRMTGNPASPRTYLERQPKGFDRPPSIPNVSNPNPQPINAPNPVQNGGNGNSSPSLQQGGNGVNPNYPNFMSNNVNQNPNLNNGGGGQQPTGGDLKTMARVNPSALPPTAIRLPMGTQVNRNSSQNPNAIPQNAIRVHPQAVRTSFGQGPNGPNGPNQPGSNPGAVNTVHQRVQIQQARSNSNSGQPQRVPLSASGNNGVGGDGGANGANNAGSNPGITSNPAQVTRPLSQGGNSSSQIQKASSGHSLANSTGNLQHQIDLSGGALDRQDFTQSPPQQTSPVSMSNSPSSSNMSTLSGPERARMKSRDPHAMGGGQWRVDAQTSRESRDSGQGQVGQAAEEAEEVDAGLPDIKLSDDVRRAIRPITSEDVEAGFAIQHPYRIATLVSQMMENEQYRYMFDALFDNLLLFPTEAEAEREDPPPQRERPLVGDAVFLSVMESGFLAADLLAKLTSAQLYYYTYLLINYDGANKKDILSAFLRRITLDFECASNLYFLQTVTGCFPDAPLTCFRVTSKVSATAEWFDTNLQLGSGKSKLKEGKQWKNLDLVDPLGRTTDAITSIVLEKIYTSATKPMLLRVFFGKDSKQIMFKRGDDLRQDYAVQAMFFLFNNLWSQSMLVNCPFILLYKIVPMGSKFGVMEFVQNCVSSGKYEWKNLFEGEGSGTRRFICSMAGSYVACWVLGIRDRHQDNMMIKDDNTFFHIDFGFIFNDAPGFDAPIFSIPRGVKANLSPKDWNFFVALCGGAFAILHQNAGVIMNACLRFFADCPHISSAQIRKYLAASLMIGESVQRAVAKIHALVEEGSSSAQKEIKYFMHGWAQKMATK